MPFKNVIILVILLVNSVCAWAQTMRFVAAPSGLRLRETPDVKGKIVVTAPYSSSVELLKKQPTAPKTLTIEGKKGKFVYVQYEEKKGYVFDGFLQEEYPQPRDVQQYVIASSGLRLREKADANGTVLATIPFGDSLKTDGEMEAFWLVKDKTPKRIFSVEGVEGFWQKVVYKNKKGFVFSGLVSTYYKPTTCTKSHIFLEEGWGCGDIVGNQDDYNWFGWYKKGNKTELKAVSKLFFSVQNGDDMESLITGTNRTLKGDTAMYIIGVRKTAAQQIVAGAISAKWYAEDYNIVDSSYWIAPKSPVFKFKNKGWELKLSVTENPVQDGMDYPVTKASLVYQSEDGTQKQTLLSFDSKKPYSDTNSYFYMVQVVWSGDLDKDGKLDFLLLQEGEANGAHVLYLSTAAGKGQYVKRIGEVFGCGC
jgi:hypothetical protein